MALTDKQKYEILTLDGKESGISRITFFKRNDMTVVSTEYIAEMIMKKIDVLDADNDISQVSVWKITEMLQNANGDNVAICISYSETKPEWVAESLVTELLS